MPAAGEGSPVLAANATALLERIRAESSSRALLARLDALRVPDDPGGEVERDRAYAEALAAAGFDADGTAPESFAAEARARGIAVPLAAAFDEWIDVRESLCLLAGADRLRVLARLLDPDPAHSSLRVVLARGSFEDLVGAIEAVDLAAVGPGTIHALDRALRSRSLETRWEGPVEALYERALPSHAEDPTLFVELARLRFARSDRAGGEYLYRVAQALRPDHPVAYAELAWELEHLDIDLTAAAGLWARAVELRPEEGLYHLALGRALRITSAEIEWLGRRCVPRDSAPYTSPGHCRERSPAAAP